MTNVNELVLLLESWLYEVRIIRSKRVPASVRRKRKQYYRRKKAKLKRMARQRRRRPRAKRLAKRRAVIRKRLHLRPGSRRRIRLASSRMMANLTEGFKVTETKDLIRGFENAIKLSDELIASVGSKLTESKKVQPDPTLNDFHWQLPSLNESIQDMSLDPEFEELLGVKKRIKESIEIYSDFDKVKSDSAYMIKQIKEGKADLTEASQILTMIVESLDKSVEKVVADHPLIESMELKWTELPSGDLEVCLKDVNDAQDIGEGEDFAEAFEFMLQNGMEMVSPEEVGALTDSPIFGEVDRDDQGNITEIHSLYWYPNYMVKNPVEELKQETKVVFEKARDESDIDDQEKEVPEESIKENEGSVSQDQAFEIFKSEFQKVNGSLDAKFEQSNSWKDGDESVTFYAESIFLETSDPQNKLSYLEKNFEKKDHQNDETGNQVEFDFEGDACYATITFDSEKALVLVDTYTFFTSEDSIDTITKQSQHFADETKKLIHALEQGMDEDQSASVKDPKEKEKEHQDAIKKKAAMGTSLPGKFVRSGDYDTAKKIMRAPHESLQPGEIASMLLSEIEDESINEDAVEKEAQKLLLQFLKKKTTDDVAQNIEGELPELTIGDVTYNWGNRELLASTPDKTFSWDLNNLGKGDRFVLFQVTDLDGKPIEEGKSQQLAYTEYEDLPSEKLSFKDGCFYLNSKEVDANQAMAWVKKHRDNLGHDFDEIFDKVLKLANDSRVDESNLTQDPKFLGKRYPRAKRELSPEDEKKLHDLYKQRDATGVQNGSDEYNMLQGQIDALLGESEQVEAPPQAWFAKMEKHIKAQNPSFDDEQAKKSVGDLWYHKLSNEKRKQILGREGKHLAPVEAVQESNPADKHQLKIAIDTVQNPQKALLGGMSVEDAKDILKRKFKYSDEDIKKLEGPAGAVQEDGLLDLVKGKEKTISHGASEIPGKWYATMTKDLKARDPKYTEDMLDKHVKGIWSHLSTEKREQIMAHESKGSAGNLTEAVKKKTPIQKLLKGPVEPRKYIPLKLGEPYSDVSEMHIDADGNPEFMIQFDTDSVLSQYMDLDKKLTKQCEKAFDEDYDGGGWANWREEWIKSIGGEVNSMGSGNTYNEDSAYFWADKTFEWTDVKLPNGKDGAIIMWHHGGDVRGNYGMPQVYQGDFMDFFGVLSPGDPKEEAAYALGYNGDHEALVADVKALLAGKVAVPVEAKDDAAIAQAGADKGAEHVYPSGEQRSQNQSADKKANLSENLKLTAKYKKILDLIRKDGHSDPQMVTHGVIHDIAKKHNIPVDEHEVNDLSMLVWDYFKKDEGFNFPPGEQRNLTQSEDEVSAEDYSFTDKESQMEALAEFINNTAKWRYEYETENEDAGQNYLDVYLEDPVRAIKEYMSREHGSELAEVIQKYLDAGVKVKEIADVAVSLVTPEPGGIEADDRAIESVMLGELEDQISHIYGRVNGKEVNDIFAVLSKDLSPQDLEQVAKNVDEAYWNPENDYISVNCGNQSWKFIVDPEALDQALAEKHPDVEQQDQEENLSVEVDGRKFGYSSDDQTEDFKSSINEKTASSTLKKYEGLKTKKMWSKQEILGVAHRMSDLDRGWAKDSMDEEFKYILHELLGIFEEGTTVDISPEQSEQGISWLKRNVINAKGDLRNTGMVRDAGFTEHEAEIIKNFKKFELVGFKHDEQSHTYTPLYRTIAQNGDHFDYSVGGGWGGASIEIHR